MEEWQTEIRSLKKKVEAVSRQLDTVVDDLKDVPRELKEVKAEIKIIRESHAKEWLDNQEVTLALGISPRTLQHMRCSGQLPFTRFHNKLFYKASDVNAILETNYLTTYPIKKQ